jgi:hypothetical protein
VHIYLYMGVRRFKFNQAVNCITSLLHGAVVLFLASLLVFLFPASNMVSFALLAGILASGTLYLTLSAFPLFHPDFPYYTPLTPILQALVAAFITVPFFAAHAVTALVEFFAKGSIYVRSSVFKTLGPIIYRLRHYLIQTARSRRATLAECASRPSNECIQYAIRIALKHIDEKHELEGFLDSIFPILSFSRREQKHHRAIFIHDRETQSASQTAFHVVLARRPVAGTQEAIHSHPTHYACPTRLHSPRSLSVASGRSLLGADTVSRIPRDVPRREFLDETARRRRQHCLIYCEVLLRQTQDGPAALHVEAPPSLADRSASKKQPWSRATPASIS